MTSKDAPSSTKRAASEVESADPESPIRDAKCRRLESTSSPRANEATVAGEDMAENGEIDVPAFSGPEVVSSEGKEAENNSERMPSLVVFGDSYSTSFFENSKTWVDFVHRRARQSDTEWSIHNFAFPGATAMDDMDSQLSRFFASFPPKTSPESLPTLDSANTCYVLFIGTNDCGAIDSEELEEIVETLFDAVHKLYVKAGARRFVFVDVPPLDRSPSAAFEDCRQEMETRVEKWNEVLRSYASELAQETPRASVSVFSVNNLMTTLLNNTEDEDGKSGKRVWIDDLHASESVHKAIADGVLKLLCRNYAQILDKSVDSQAY